jgi:hypothetical protein
LGLKFGRMSVLAAFFHGSDTHLGVFDPTHYVLYFRRDGGQQAEVDLPQILRPICSRKSRSTRAMSSPFPTYTGHRPPAKAPNLGSAAADTRSRLERVKTLQLCLM